MHCKIEVIPPDPVDSAVDAAFGEHDLDRTATTTQIPKNEPDSESSRKGPRRIIGLGLAETESDLAPVEEKTTDRRERKNTVRRAWELRNRSTRKPVAAESYRLKSESPAADEQELYRLWVVKSNGHQAIAHRESAESQSFFLRQHVDLIGARLALELTFEIVEEIVPAHRKTVATPGRWSPRLSTAPRWGMDTDAKLL